MTPNKYYLQLPIGAEHVRLRPLIRDIYITSGPSLLCKCLLFVVLREALCKSSLVSTLFHGRFQYWQHAAEWGLTRSSHSPSAVA